MKKIFNRNLTHKQLRKLIIDVAKDFGVSRVCFNNRGIYVRGTYDCATKALYLDLKQDKKQLLNVFFHELGHHESVENNKWVNYHHTCLSKMSVNKIFYVENKIDGIAKKLWNKYVNANVWGKYKYIYSKAQKKNIVKILHRK